MKEEPAKIHEGNPSKPEKLPNRKSQLPVLLKVMFDFPSLKSKAFILSL